jgi:hypothetical protein
MSDNSNYQTKLSQLYQLAVSSNDVRSFFTHLYNYVEYICSEDKLNDSAWELYAISFDKENTIDDKDPKLSMFQKEVSEPQSMLLLSLHDALHNYKGATRVYYCWAKLQLFYSQYLNSSDAKVEAALKKNVSKKSKDYILSSKVEFNNIFKENSDTNNKHYKRDKYQLSLDVFHTGFIEWLQESREGTSEKRTEVTLSFDDIYPVVTNTVTQDVYRFGRMVQTGTPYKIINFCRTKPGIFVSAATLPQNIQLNKKGLLDTLRGSDFYPGKGALSVFITAKKRPAKIMLHSKVQLNDLKLQALIKEADEVITNS